MDTSRLDFSKIEADKIANRLDSLNKKLRRFDATSERLEKSWVDLINKAKEIKENELNIAKGSQESPKEEKIRIFNQLIKEFSNKIKDYEEELMKRVNKHIRSIELFIKRVDDFIECLEDMDLLQNFDNPRSVIINLDSTKDNYEKLKDFFNHKKDMLAKDFIDKVKPFAQSISSTESQAVSLLGGIWENFRVNCGYLKKSLVDRRNLRTEKINKINSMNVHALENIEPIEKEISRLKEENKQIVLAYKGKEYDQTIVLGDLNDKKKKIKENKKAIKSDKEKVEKLKDIYGRGLNALDNIDKQQEIENKLLEFFNGVTKREEDKVILLVKSRFIAA